MSAPILLVDDELKVLKAYERNLMMDFDVAVESSPDQALMRLEHEGPFAVVLTDYNMPRMCGNELLKRACEVSPDTVRIMLTGYADLEKTITAVNEGSVFRFLTKPCPLEKLQKCLNDAVRQYELVTAEKELLNKTLNGSIQVMVEILSIMNHSAFSLAQKRRAAAKIVAKELSVGDTWAIEIGALLSDVGMVTLPDDTMQRYLSSAKLSETEQKMVERLPEMSAKLIDKIPRLEKVAEIVKYQKKDYNGGGFPVDGVKGEGIPIGARILRLINDYFRIVSKGTSPRDAYSMLNLSHEWYDRRVLKSLAKALNVIESPDKSGTQLREIGTNALKVGQILRSDVYGKNGMLILRANQVIGAAHIQRICNFDASSGVVEPLLVEGP